jgi:hypothetical protein
MKANLGGMKLGTCESSWAGAANIRSNAGDCERVIKSVSESLVSGGGASCHVRRVPGVPVAGKTARGGSEL